MTYSCSDFTTFARKAPSFPRRGGPGWPHSSQRTLERQLKIRAGIPTPFRGLSKAAAHPPTTARSA